MRVFAMGFGPRSSRSCAVIWAVLVYLAITVAACSEPEAPQAAPGAATVGVAEVISRSVTDFDEFTGRFVAIERVELRPRVSGYVARMPFVQGKEVKAGDVLYVIDPRPYRASVDQAQAEVERSRSLQAQAVSDQARAESLLAAKAISREEYDQRVSGVKQAAAATRSAEAALSAARLELEFTEVRAPISGLVGRAEVTVGNLVNAGQTLLTTIVSLDPIYAEFVADERALLRYGEMARKGERASGRDYQHPVQVGLANDEGHPHTGALVFVDNAINPATGTILARGKFDNADRRFSPGLFARIRLPGSGQYEAVLIRDSAIGTDQNVKFVLVVDDNGTTSFRPIQIGPLVEGLRVVRQGLKPGEKIVVTGLQRVRPGQPVTPQMVAMQADAVAATTPASAP